MRQITSSDFRPHGQKIRTWSKTAYCKNGETMKEKVMSISILPCSYKGTSNNLLLHGTVRRRDDRNFFWLMCKPAYMIHLHPNMAAKVYQRRCLLIHEKYIFLLLTDNYKAVRTRTKQWTPQSPSLKIIVIRQNIEYYEIRLPYSTFRLF